TPRSSESVRRRSTAPTTPRGWRRSCNAARPSSTDAVRWSGELGRLDLHGLRGSTVLPATVDARLDNLVDDVHVLLVDRAEHRVLRCQRGVFVDNEELAPAAVRLCGLGHGNRAPRVDDGFAVLGRFQVLWRFVRD